MAESSDFTSKSLLGPDGVYKDFIVAKGDKAGHVFRGNQHSPGGVGHFDPWKTTFLTICAHGHSNTITIPSQWVERDDRGRPTGQFSAGNQTHSCVTCQRPLANRWRMVRGQDTLPRPDAPVSASAWLYGGPKNYVG